MVDDAGGFMRGCANLPGFVGSGPTGAGSWGWDFDGSYGDWYGGHELGHAYGRPHANFCGAEGGGSYPYSNGGISPSLSGDQAIYGFDIHSQEIYTADWSDVMSYCPNQWLSDFTYEALLAHFQNNPILTHSATPMDRLSIIGTIDPATNQVELAPLFIIPDADDIEPRTPGDYAIVLRNSTGVNWHAIRSHLTR
ncbi:MAG: hypothetical protein H6668_14720 [Ardenticatenaceae bacterium]|nr:hypothetical protein [Ardenticatenaceae bacterium]